MPTDTLPWTGLFDLFRIGVGPSSSHTVGPMVTVARLVSELLPGTSVHATTVQLFGFLALTGKGHATDVAVIPGLLGAAMQACVDRGLRQEGQLPGGLGVRRRAPGLHAPLVQRQGGNARDVLHGDGPHFVSLGQVIRTMRDTGRDTSSKHKETSEGRLAVNAIEC